MISMVPYDRIDAGDNITMMVEAGIDMKAFWRLMNFDQCSVIFTCDSLGCFMFERIQSVTPSDMVDSCGFTLLYD